MFGSIIGVMKVATRSLDFGGLSGLGALAWTV